ncbi:MAG: hypothetical protein A2Z34_05975 [Planctomycetes bacterium RBG_16_59_8]|nr:MAG: hypothetical protein A2Z34_05975 [Planctomycetes bacterium RBG_16_59_8]
MQTRRNVDHHLDRIESRLSGIDAMKPENPASFKNPQAKESAASHVGALIESVKAISLHILRDFKEVMSPESIFADLKRIRLLPENFSDEGDAVIARSPKIPTMSPAELSAYMVKVREIFTNYVRYIGKYAQTLP